MKTIIGIEIKKDSDAARRILQTIAIGGNVTVQIKQSEDTLVAEYENEIFGRVMNVNDARLIEAADKLTSCDVVEIGHGAEATMAEISRISNLDYMIAYVK